MLIVKVSTPWSHINFNSRISKLHPDKKYRFDFSDECHVCDFWIIWGGIRNKNERVSCPPQNVIYLTDEVHVERNFNQAFLDQFAAVISCRNDLHHKKIIGTHELNTWLIDRDYDHLYRTNNLKKSKELSVVSSDHTWLPGHKLRFAFVNKLIGHFKDKIDVYGRGFNPIQDKYDALAPYKYSVAIENSVIPGYFTEKLTDCYLTLTMPIYYGCPDIKNYFDENSFLHIDPNDFKGSVSKIESLMQKNTYDSVTELLTNEKKKYLEQYHIFNKLPELLELHFNTAGKKSNKIIKNESVFLQGPVKKLIKQFFKK